MTNGIECIIYQNPLAIRHLSAVGVRDDGRSLIIEMSAASVLAPVFDQQAQSRLGIAGLLSGTPLSSLGRSFEGVRNPIVLGSRPAVPVYSSLGAAAHMRNIEIPFERVLVMVHLAELDRLSYLLQLASRFVILLADSDPVPFALPAKVQLMARMQVLDSSSWGGLCYFNPAGGVPGDGVSEACEEVLAGFEDIVRLPRRDAA